MYLYQLIKVKNLNLKPRVVQKIFLKFLFDMRPLVQEVSSKGLTEIYEMSDEDGKRELV